MMNGAWSKMHTEKFLADIKSFHRNVVGQTLGGNKTEDEIRIYLLEILQHYRNMPRKIDYKPFIAENFSSNEPVELKRMLQSRNNA